jgi:hypothetical protein
LVRRRKTEGTALAPHEWFAAFETGGDGCDAFAAFLGTSSADGSGWAGEADGGAAGGGTARAAPDILADQALSLQARINFSMIIKRLPTVP